MHSGSLALSKINEYETPSELCEKMPLEHINSWDQFSVPRKLEDKREIT